jgi:hypothetical protein
MKHLKKFQKFTENYQNNTILINTLSDLSEYINKYWPNIWNLVHGTAHTAFEVLSRDMDNEDDLEMEHISEESWNQALESFYDGNLQDEIDSGNIQINLTREEVLNWISDRCSAGSE